MSKFDARFGLNYDGPQVHFGTHSMPGRDQGGRFVGQIANDDEIVDQADRLVDLTHFPDFACTFFGINVVADTADTDDEEGWDDQLEQLVWMFDDCEPLYAGDKYELKYRPLLPHLWEDDGEYWFEEGLESVSSEEATTYSFYMDKWEFFHPELLDDEEVLTAASSQSNEQHDDYLKKLGWYAERSDRGWRQAHGKHGRQHSTERQKKREANRTTRKTFRTVEGRQQIAAENDWVTANYWSADMADFDGQMTFWTKHPEGQTADYYRRLLAVNHINQELKSEWLDAYGEWDEWLELDEIYRADTAREDAYRWGEYAVRPTYDWLMDTYTHPKNLSIHGWHYLDLPYREQHHFLEREREEERLREMEDDRQEWLHRRFMASIYGHPFDDFDDYVGPSLRDDFDEEEGRREQDDSDYQAMVDAEADGWNEIDFMEHERQLDAMDEAATLSQHGGPRGWKAGKVANLRLAEFA